MEPATASSGGGVTVAGSDVPSDFHVAPRSENPNPSPGSAQPRSAAPPLPTPNAAAPAMPVKKKRGRPRKYGPDGSATLPLSPKPISSAAPPPVIDFSTEKRQKVKPANSVSKTKFEMENLGEWVACPVGANFTPHIITVNSGEDVTMKIISFSQQGPRAICVLCANGVISSVTLRQPDSSGGTLTYEGRFEILSLSGSFMPNESGGTRSRTGGMSVSLASPDGRVVGGGVAGLLVAASPVQGHFEILSLSGSLVPITNGGEYEQSGGINITFSRPNGHLCGGAVAGVIRAATAVKVHVSSFVLGNQP
ncbi:putative DNA-binding protein ESCAROLA [Tripterygium wilfordii]|uniref:AT-hook motif nuclear-localized protein n=1 Tax=Tripterygium wilfordii TaxID=458696 RepID=A0A7J7CLC0_TRIWF|nr:putative DNA-binding protein ESCAROLA [Tripterygium wilfordii]